VRVPSIIKSDNLSEDGDNFESFDNSHKDLSSMRRLKLFGEKSERSFKTEEVDFDEDEFSDEEVNEVDGVRFARTNILKPTQVSILMDTK
jgi:hypothetical protein